MPHFGTADALGSAFAVSRETLDRLRRYEMLLREWAGRINLVSPASLAEVWHRHFADSAQLLGLAPPEARTWLDLGSGAGFPGMVIALLAAEARPALGVTLVEADQRKAAFLLTVARETGTRVTIEPRRIESLAPRRFDVVSARALAPLPRLVELAAPFLGPGSVALFPKGARAESELTAARRAWHSRVREVESMTDPAARILILTEVRRAG
jgi:16S rRNA (guanine527-N7)-methyltransferase